MKKMKTKIVSASIFSLLMSLVFVANAQEFPVSPSEVQNVTATAGDGFVTLNWDRGTDPDGVVVGYKVYYGTHAVSSEDDVYDDEITVENVLSYKVENLTNGTEYFFAVTGIDDESLEGETYSVEVSATPVAPVSEVEETAVPEETPPPVAEEEPAVTPPTQEETVTPTPETTLPTEETTEVFEGPAYPAAPVDEVAPLDAMNLSVDSARLEAENIVVINWTPSANTDNDAIDQVLYTRRGTEEWDSGYSLGMELNSLELEVDPDQNYEVKMVTVDQSGNESTGVTLSFSTALSATGPGTIGTVIALSVALFCGLVLWGRRRAY
jgi:hypothetical protein